MCHIISYKNVLYKQNKYKKTHFLLGRIVDCCQSDESTDMLSIFLKDHMIPAKFIHIL